MGVHNQVRHEEITSHHDGQRLDNYLISKLKGVPKKHIYRLIRTGQVRLNRGRTKPSARVYAKDIVRIPPVMLSDNLTAKKIKPNRIDFLKDAVLFENKAFMVINKPAGMAVHGGSGIGAGVIEMLRCLYEDDTLELVHRLDRDTSGLLLVAKKRSFLRLAHQLLRDKQVDKTYLACLSGRWQGHAKRSVVAPLLKRHTASGERKVSIHEEGKPSKTHFELLENFDNACLVKASPVTGRTHQIRVHAQSIGHPIIGDSKYNVLQNLGAPSSCELPNRLFLHAYQLDFKALEDFHFEALPDKVWQAFIKALKEQAS